MSREYQQSMISFADYKDPITDEVSAVLMDRPGGRKTVVAYIRKEYFDSSKEPYYRVYDTQGKIIMGGSRSLSLVKEEVLRNEQQFHEETALKEQAIQQDFAEEERKRLNDLRTIRAGKTKEHSRTR